MEGDGSLGEGLVAAFAKWSAGQRAAQAARNRSVERSLREQSAGSATWVGSLVDLAETGSRVTLVVGESRLTGALEAVGLDFCVVVRAGRRPVLIRLDRVAAVWPGNPGGAAAAGSRFPALDLSLTSALSMLAEEHAPVNVAVTGGHQVAGELLSAGEDVLAVRTADGARRSVLVQLSSVEYCELR
jgi:hypothetical protein